MAKVCTLPSAILVDGVKALLVALLKINCANVIRGYTKVGTVKYIVRKIQLEWHSAERNPPTRPNSPLYFSLA